MHLSLFTTFCLPNILVCPPNIFDKSTPMRHAILDLFLPPLQSLCHTSRDPPKVRHISRTLGILVVQKSPVQNLSMVRRVFVRGFLFGKVLPFSPFCQYTSVTTES